MAIDFLRPLFLLLLLVVPGLWFWPRRVERLGHGLLRSAGMAALIVAMAGPVWLSSDGPLHQVLILDQSDSLSAEQRSRAHQLLAGWQQRVGRNERTAVIVMGKDEDLPVDLAKALPERSWLQDPLSGSSLATALAMAERRIPEGSAGVVTLISDGLATDRRWGPAVQRMIRRGIPVETYDLGVQSRVRAVRLTADPLLRIGHTARVTVEIEGLDAASGVRVRLSDSSARELALSASLTKAGDGRVAVALEFVPRETGFLPLRVDVLAAEAGDAAEVLDTYLTTVAVQSPLRLWYVGDRMRQGADRLRELLGAGFEVTDGSGPQRAGESAPAGYELVMVDDRPAALMPEELQARIAASVRHDGVGLLFSGGKASFGTGGYEDSTLAEMLPVDFVQRTEKRDPSTALAVIIDTSGSMGGNRIELAKQVTRLAIRRLKAHDRVGLVEFYGNKHWALPMQSAANKIAIDRAIGRMQALGGTVLYPAIEEAYYALKNVDTRYKHILIITDAGVENADYESLSRRIARDKIALSTVLVGSQAHSQSLIDIASWGRGRFYSASDRYALPETVLKQATTMNLPAYKNGRFPLVGRGGPGWWGEVDRAAVPALFGYVETQARPGAEVLLEVEGGGHPVLSSWQYGLGRVTALMTEPVGDGTAGWGGWTDYGQWLARVAARTAGDLRGFRYSVHRDDHRVRIEARRYGAALGVAPRAARLAAGDREGSPVEFRQVSPDHFMAEFVIDPQEELRLVAGGDAGDASTWLVAPARADVSAEHQVDPLTALDLATLARATGGTWVDATREVTVGAAPAARAGSGALTLLELGPFAALLALALYLAELAFRRRFRGPSLSSS